MIRVKLLKVRPVAALGWTVEHEDQTRPLPPAPPYPACDLDVLRCRLRLADDSHEGEPVDINTDFDDARCEARVNYAALGCVIDCKPVHHVDDLSLGKPAREFLDCAEIPASLIRNRFTILKELQS